jgi:hypothetical protein
MSRNRMFAIEVVKPSNVTGSAGGLGRITVDDFSETFQMSFDFWEEADYRRHWRRALQRLDHGVEVTACLVSSITDPRSSNFIRCWPLYRRGDVVHVQEALIFLEELDSGFDPDEPWLSVTPRQVVTEDGDRISEWETDISAVRRFLTSEAG